uniref:Ig-like domain-containing protein n=1 Tax=Periophthalmus magnuspinnatus TaxID=409849 RepID=A0A3B4B9Z8_9GOBI
FLPTFFVFHLLFFLCIKAYLDHCHEANYIVGCFFNGTTQISLDLDGDLCLYADFENDDVALTLPPFFYVNTSQFPHLYRNALRAKKLHSAPSIYIYELPNLTSSDPPESILYPAEEVLLEVENSLVCFVNHFYPPVITVTWTKNNRLVSEGVSTSTYISNDDQTFHCFSTLTFTPEDGDVYSCTVEHPALEEPKTQSWISTPHKRHQDLALDLYCGVGLTVALLGVAIGTFLIIKGRYGH